MNPEPENSLQPSHKRLKIAILVRRFVTTGGMERYCLEVTRRLAAEHDVHVFAQEWSWRGDEKITFHRIPRFFNKPSFLNQLIFSFFTHRALDDSFDIIHSHERVTRFDTLTVHCPCFRTYITEEKKWWKRALIWCSIIISPRKTAYVWLENRQFAHNNKRMLIAVSNMIKENVQSNYPLPDDYFGQAFPGVDAGLITRDKENKKREIKRSELGIHRDDLVILFVGTEFERKGLEALLKGFDLIVKPHIKLVIAGEGEKKRKYKRLIKDLDIKDNVIFLGLVEEMKSIYEISDIFILPTLSEPAGMAPIEAMASGLPVIISSSSYAGITEQIKNREALILKNPDQPREIADSLSRLMDEDFRRDLGDKGRDLARHMTWEKTTEDTLAVYHRIIELKKTGSSPN